MKMPLPAPRGLRWHILPPMKSIETEVKFRVSDGADLERRLSGLGFRQVTPRTFERNVLYDTPERRLRADGQILRIREYGPKWVITHKGLPANNSAEARHKQRIETETEVADGEALGLIFEAIGLQPAFIYEKWRTEWADETGHCVLDETPLGTFAELEGPPEWIDQTGDRLGVEQSEFMTLSYGRLFDVWKEKTGSPAQHLTFEAIPSRPL